MSADSEQEARHTLVDELPPMPGLVIRSEILDRLKITQAGFARAMGISPPWLNQMLTGRNPICLEFALRLGKVTGTDPVYWMELQTRFSLYQESIELQETLDKLVKLAAHAYVK